MDGQRRQSGAGARASGVLTPSGGVGGGPGAQAGGAGGPGSTEWVVGMK